MESLTQSTPEAAGTQGQTPTLPAAPQAPAPSEAREQAAYYLRYARGERSMAFWDRHVGIWPKGVTIRQSPGFVRAATARAIAKAYRLEEKTGVAHCHCHLQPSTVCRNKPDNRPYWKRG